MIKIFSHCDPVAELLSPWSCLVRNITRAVQLVARDLERMSEHSETIKTCRHLNGRSHDNSFNKHKLD